MSRVHGAQFRGLYGIKIPRRQTFGRPHLKTPSCPQNVRSVQTSSSWLRCLLWTSKRFSKHTRKFRDYQLV